MEKTGLKPTDELVKLAVSGDAKAFTALWDRNIDQLKSYLRSWLKQLDDFYIDDICSRSFEKAFRQLGSYDSSRSQFYTWLKTISHNTALDILDKEGRVHPRNQTVYIDDGNYCVQESDMLPDEVDSPLDTIIRTENREATEKYIESLPELYREVARKRLLEGMPYKEIASETGLELNTVRTRIRRAKLLIDKHCEEEI